MTLVLQWVPPAPSSRLAPAAVVGPPGIREALQARIDGLIPADTPDSQLTAVYAAYLAAQAGELVGPGFDAAIAAQGEAFAQALGDGLGAEASARSTAITSALSAEATARSEAIDDAVAPVAAKAEAALPADELDGALAALALGGGALVAGQWKAFGRMPRLRLVGTGTVTIDARNRLGAVTAGVASYTITAATNQIEFPYFGDDAVEVRAAFTGSAAAEII